MKDVTLIIEQEFHHEVTHGSLEKRASYHGGHGEDRKFDIWFKKILLYTVGSLILGMVFQNPYSKLISVPGLAKATNFSSTQLSLNYSASLNYVQEFRLNRL